MFKNNIILDVRNDIINIDGFEYELNIGRQNLSQCDDEIIEKTRIYETKNTTNELGDIVSFYRRRNYKIGKVEVFEHEIELVGKFKPPKTRYSVPLYLRDEVKEHLNKLIKDDIIEISDTTYISPAFFIKKANGKLRLIVDYRNLNAITKKNHTTYTRKYPKYLHVCTE
ncbi:Pro-Pol polyprotein [Dictyocoela muelleri]|nr:Pro-Pol polyprotein [Dictyocoela muelleri]